MGVRRCGKSSLLFTIVEELVNNYGVKENNIIYIDLDKKENIHITTVNDLENKIESEIDSKNQILITLFTFLLMRYKTLLIMKY